MDYLRSIQKVVALHLWFDTFWSGFQNLRTMFVTESVIQLECKEFHAWTLVVRTFGTGFIWYKKSQTGQVKMIRWQFFFVKKSHLTWLYNAISGSESLTLRRGRTSVDRFLLILGQEKPLKEFRTADYVNISTVTNEWCLLYFSVQIYVIEHMSVSVFFFSWC